MKINIENGIHHSVRDDSLLRVAGVLHVCNETDWSFPMHSHDDVLDLVLIIRGKGTLFFNNQKYPTQKGDLLVFNQDVLHGEYTDPNDPLEIIVVNLKGVQAEGLPYNHLLPLDTLPIVKTGEQFQLMYYLFQFIKDECMKQADGFALLCKDSTKLILTIVQSLLERYNHQKADDEMSFPVIQEIIDYLNLNFNKNIRLEDLEHKFHFSQYYLSHKFKDETGLTINQYLTNRRLGEAKKQLVYTDLSITEIAQNVGYDNLSHFYTIFKKHTGVSPTKLKETYKR